MATIKDVAKLAHVSTATVSRVLNGNYPVTFETKRAVLQAVKQCKYRPNIYAKGLKINKTYVIGLIVPDISNSYYIEIAKGLENIISRFGYTLCLCSSEGRPIKELKLLEALNDKRMDYVVLASKITDKTQLEILMDKGLKIMMVDTYLDDINIDKVVEDNYEAAFKLCKLALDHGHKKIGIVKSLDNVSTSEQRYQGYLDALAQANVIHCKRYEVDGGNDRMMSYQETLKMLRGNANDLPTCMYAIDSATTEGLLQACKQMNLQVPQDISIISYGNITRPELYEPKLTYVEQNAQQIGEKVGALLMQRLEIKDANLQPAKYIVNNKIIEQDSIKKVK